MWNYPLKYQNLDVPIHTFLRGKSSLVAWREIQSTTHSEHAIDCGKHQTTQPSCCPRVKFFQIWSQMFSGLKSSWKRCVQKKNQLEATLCWTALKPNIQQEMQSSPKPSESRGVVLTTVHKHNMCGDVSFLFDKPLVKLFSGRLRSCFTLFDPKTEGHFCSI